MSGWLAARNLLAVRLDNAGDVVMLGPALRAIKESSPAARLTLLATPAGAAAASLLPWVDDVIVWRPLWQDLGRSSEDPARDRSLIADLARRRFDAALVFSSFSQTPHVPGYVCYLAGIPLRAGESKEFGGATLTDELRGAPDDLHQVERNLRLIENLGFPVRDRRLHVSLTDAARADATQHLRSLGIEPDAPWVLLHPGASARARRYPGERYAVVARRFKDRGVDVLVTGTDRESSLVEEIAGEAGVPFLAGETSMPQFAALIERAALVVCGNTLPLHLADAVGTRVVVLYSGTDLESQWTPRVVSHRLLRRQTACHPCYLFDCPIGQPCLDISPSEVVDAAMAILAGANRPPALMEGVA